MSLSGLLQQCQTLVEQGKLDQALAFLTRQVLPSLMTVSGSPQVGTAGYLPHAIQSERELRHCFSLIQDLLRATRGQQQDLRQRLRCERNRTLGRNAYAELST